MSCFTGCLNKSQHLSQNQFVNRYTQLPMNFSPNERDELAKRFKKVSNNKEFITLQMFKKNMGILGLHCSQEFSQRLFNAFDLDNDNKIGLQDFLEYMYILRGNNDALKARISFKMIVPPRESIVTKEIFKKFLSDFFVSWSYVTSIDITCQIKERTNKYIDFLFKKVEKETGKPEINLKYYVSNLYKDKDYMESFEFITQGMADIFIGEKTNDPQAVLYKVVKQIYQIKETVFEMSNEQSYMYEPVRLQEIPHYLPNFDSPLFKKPKNNKTQNQKYRKDSDTNTFKKSQYSNRDKKPSYDHSETHTATKSNCFYEERRWESKELYETSKIAALQKKLKFIEEKIDKIVQQTKNIYQIIKQKFQKKTEFKRTKDQRAAKNVHKRIKNAQGDMVFIGDQNWNLVLNMMIGIQVAVRSSKGLQEIICEEPKDFRLKYCFELIPRRFGDEDYHSRVCSFTDYAPNTFNHIRKIFKIDSQDYINSIGPNKLMASLMMGEVSSMTSLTSQGKSGSFFYYTADGKYTLKTIQYREYRFLRQILEDYYYYIKQNPDTLITKFFGLHKLIQKNQKGQEIGRSYFVIMANVFNTKEKITERYDIKGSWYGRQTADSDPLATKKDNDFKKREPLYLAQEDRTKLLAAIKKDAKFFEEHQIIDYSLLIGVIKKSQNFSDYSDGRNESRLNREEDQEDMMRESKVYYGGMTGQNSQSYIFGIIDILTLYEQKQVYLVPEKFQSTTSSVWSMEKEFQQCPLMNTHRDFAALLKKMFWRQEERKATDVVSCDEILFFIYCQIVNKSVISGSEVRWPSYICFKLEMIENVMYVEELLHNLQYELWDIGPLNPSDFVARLQQFQLAGWEDKIVAMLRQAVHQYQAERAIMKYLYIADKLVRVPYYQNVANPAFVDLYCDVFYFLFAQKCNKQLEELKILRKFWVGSIHPFYLAQMKDKLLTKTGIDIDSFSKPQTIAKIKAHYANKLNMTPQQIDRQFPPPVIRFSEDRRLPPQNYLQQPKSNYPTFYPAINNSHFQVPPLHYPYQNPQQNIVNEALHLPNDPRLSNGDAKRKRFASQETRAVVATVENYETKPKKSQHRDTPIVDFKVMLVKLKQINRFQCKECGINFNAGESLQKHKDEHLKEKLAIIDGGSWTQMGQLCSEQKWLGEKGEMSCDLFVIGEESWGEEALCACCCCEMVRFWVDDQWVFVNASIVSIQGRRSLMHKSCQRILENSVKKVT